VVVGYDVIKKRQIITRDGADLGDCDLLSLASLNGLASNLFLEFVGALARRNPINPVAAWINSKPWDSKDRLPELYATVQTARDFPARVRDYLLYRWLLSCVAAALKPDGFKARGVLTLQGPQGAGKTSWIARLVPNPMNADWVKLDHHLDGHNKDSIIGAVTHWITEIGELDSSFRKDVARIKGFLTNDCDKLRLPYARSPIEMPRRTVFAGTVNEWHFLVDQTGNSRWWTIPIEKLDFEHNIDMQQVFAQLAVDFHQGQQWWLTPDEEVQLEALNKRHKAVSVIEERLLERIAPSTARHRYMTASKVLEAIGIRSPSNAQCREAGGVLRSVYGDPKRVNGTMKWKVALTPDDVWKADPDDDPIDHGEVY
jgi:putative DNA primase/helicase